MILKPINLNIDEFPDKVRKYLVDANISDSSSHSDAKVYYSDKGYFIKTAPEHSLSKEAENAGIFYEMGLGVKVELYISAGKDYLVTQKAIGEDLTHFKGNTREICEILYKSMSQIDRYKNSNVGISLAMQHYKSFIPNNNDAKITEFTEYLGISSSEDAKGIIHSHKGILKNNGIIHGDMCLPNIIKADDGKITFIDLGYAGSGDKNIDIYWATWSLWYNIGLAAAKMFLENHPYEYSPEAVRYIAACEALS